MWKVLGKETPLVAAGDVWKEKLIELSKRRKERERFLSMMDAGTVRYIFDAVREVHAFIVNLPQKYKHDDLEFFKGFVLKVVKGTKTPVIELDGAAQKYTVVITSEQEKDEYLDRYAAWKKKEMAESAAPGKKQRNP